MWANNFICVFINNGLENFVCHIFMKDIHFKSFGIISIQFGVIFLSFSFAVSGRVWHIDVAQVLCYTHCIWLGDCFNSLKCAFMTYIHVKLSFSVFVTNGTIYLATNLLVRGA